MLERYVEVIPCSKEDVLRVYTHTYVYTYLYIPIYIPIFMHCVLYTIIVYTTTAYSVQLIVYTVHIHTQQYTACVPGFHHYMLAALCAVH
jgi:hypothetical protein